VKAGPVCCTIFSIIYHLHQYFVSGIIKIFVKTFVKPIFYIRFNKLFNILDLVFETRPYQESSQECDVRRCRYEGGKTAMAGTGLLAWLYGASLSPIPPTELPTRWKNTCRCSRMSTSLKDLPRYYVPFAKVEEQLPRTLRRRLATWSVRTPRTDFST